MRRIRISETEPASDFFIPNEPVSELHKYSLKPGDVHPGRAYGEPGEGKRKAIGNFQFRRAQNKDRQTPQTKTYSQYNLQHLCSSIRSKQGAEAQHGRGLLGLLVRQIEVAPSAWDESVTRAAKLKRPSLLGLPLLSPDSRAALAWRAAMLLFDLTFTAFWVPLDVGFCVADYGNLARACTRSDLAGGCIYLLNLLMGLQVGAVLTGPGDSRRALVTDGPSLAYFYAAHGYLAMDTLSCVPFFVLLSAIASPDSTSHGRRLLSLLSLLRLVRMMRLVSMVKSVYRGSGGGAARRSWLTDRVSVSAMYLAVLFYQFAVFVNVFASLMIMLLFYYEDGAGGSWLATFAAAGVVSGRPEDIPAPRLWYHAIYWTVTVVTTTGAGMAPRRPGEQVVANVASVYGMVFSGLVVGIVGRALLQATGDASTVYLSRRKLTLVGRWGRLRHLSHSLMRDLQAYFSASDLSSAPPTGSPGHRPGGPGPAASLPLGAESAIIECLPPTLRRAVVGCLVGPLLERVHVLDRADPELRELMAASFRPIDVPAGQDLCVQGGEADRLWLLEWGRVAARRRGEAAAHPSTGMACLLGEGVLLRGQLADGAGGRPWGLRAVAPCRLWELHWVDLEPLMRTDPRLAGIAMEYTRERLVALLEGAPQRDAAWAEHVALLGRVLKSRGQLDGVRDNLTALQEARLDDGSLAALLSGWLEAGIAPAAPLDLGLPAGPGVGGGGRRGLVTQSLMAVHGGQDRPALAGAPSNIPSSPFNYPLGACSPALSMLGPASPVQCPTGPLLFASLTAAAALGNSNGNGSYNGPMMSVAAAGSMGAGFGGGPNPGVSRATTGVPPSSGGGGALSRRGTSEGLRNMAALHSSLSGANDGEPLGGAAAVRSTAAAAALDAASGAAARREAVLSRLAVASHARDAAAHGPYSLSRCPSDGALNTHHSGLLSTHDSYEVGALHAPMPPAHRRSLSAEGAGAAVRASRGQGLDRGVDAEDGHGGRRGGRASAAAAANAEQFAGQEASAGAREGEGGDPWVSQGRPSPERSSLVPFSFRAFKAVDAGGHPGNPLVGLKGRGGEESSTGGRGTKEVQQPQRHDVAHGGGTDRAAELDFPGRGADGRSRGPQQPASHDGGDTIPTKAVPGLGRGGDDLESEPFASPSLLPWVEGRNSAKDAVPDAPSMIKLQGGRRKSANRAAAEAGRASPHSPRVAALRREAGPRAEDSGGIGGGGSSAAGQGRIGRQGRRRSAYAGAARSDEEAGGSDTSDGRSIELPPVRTGSSPGLQDQGKEAQASRSLSWRRPPRRQVSLPAVSSPPLRAGVAVLVASAGGGGGSSRAVATMASTMSPLTAVPSAAGARGGPAAPPAAACAAPHACPTCGRCTCPACRARAVGAAQALERGCGTVVASSAGVGAGAGVTASTAALHAARPHGGAPGGTIATDLRPAEDWMSAPAAGAALRAPPANGVWAAAAAAAVVTQSRAATAAGARAAEGVAAGRAALPAWARRSSGTVPGGAAAPGGGGSQGPQQPTWRRAGRSALHEELGAPSVVLAPYF